MLKLSTYGPRRAPKPVVRPDTPQVTDVTDIGSYPGSPISVLFSERIIVTPSFSTDGTCFIMLEFYDMSGNFIGLSEKIFIQAYDVPFFDDPDRLSGTMYVVANELGASYVKVRLLETPSNGANITVYISST
jgi:hypothetical protein